MTPYYEKDGIVIYHGDSLATLRTLPDCSVQCCVTSPPYWGLRDYGADGQMGLESTPEEYVAGMVTLFREVRRVLADDGTLWLNLGDSYATQPGKGDNVPQTKWSRNTYPKSAAHRSIETPGLKPKDLCGIPWRVALALQADGWWLRQDIIWHKPNPMPESVTDRCTKAHEYVFLLSKSQRYYFDADAIKERSATLDPRRPYGSEGGWQMDGRGAEKRPNGKPRTAGHKTHKYVTEYEASETEEHRTKSGLMKVADVPWEKRNRRSVWTIPTQPFPGAHFAVFPPKLIEPCIMAGCPEGGIVLDPFNGSGTTCWQARELGRKAIGCELNSEYCDLAINRLAQGVLF
jgi:DNA modification methylase